MLCSTRWYAAWCSPALNCKWCVHLSTTTPSGKNIRPSLERYQPLLYSSSLSRRSDIKNPSTTCCLRNDQRNEQGKIRRRNLFSGRFANSNFCHPNYCLRSQTFSIVDFFSRNVSCDKSLAQPTPAVAASNHPRSAIALSTAIWVASIFSPNTLRNLVRNPSGGPSNIKSSDALQHSMVCSLMLSSTQL